MDTESFLIRRQHLVSRLEDRRSRDLSAYPFKAAGAFGIHIPIWARLALSFVSRGGLASTALQLALPAIATLFVKKKSSFLSRIIAHFSPSKA